MEEILKYTYQFDLEKLSQAIENLWKKYLSILENKQSSADDLYSARAILYFLGYLYPEKIALEALERRLVGLSLEEFLIKADRQEIKNELTNFYEIIKELKNKEYRGSYLGEALFNQVYEQKTGQKPKHKLD